MENIPLRHGDWTFIPTNQKLHGEKIKMKENKYTFAEGEATGHFHTLHAPSVDDMTFMRLADGSYLVELKKDGFATHPEHSMKTDLFVPAGRYILRQRREKDWFSLAVRKVID